jgi:hypothetical protein
MSTTAVSSSAPATAEASSVPATTEHRSVPIMINIAAHTLAFIFALSASVRAAYGVFHALKEINRILAMVVCSISFVGTLIAMWRLAREEMHHYTDSLVNSYLDYMERDDDELDIRTYNLDKKRRDKLPFDFINFAREHHHVMTFYRHYAEQADKLGLTKRAKANYISHHVQAEFQQQHARTILQRAQKSRKKMQDWLSTNDVKWLKEQEQQTHKSANHALKCQQTLLRTILAKNFDETKTVMRDNKEETVVTRYPFKSLTIQSSVTPIAQETTDAINALFVPDEKEATLKLTTEIARYVFCKGLQEIDVRYGILIYRHTLKLVHLTGEKLIRCKIKYQNEFEKRRIASEALDKEYIIEFLKLNNIHFKVKEGVSIEQTPQFQALLKLRRNQRDQAILRHKHKIELIRQNAVQLDQLAQQQYLEYCFTQELSFCEQCELILQPREIRKQAQRVGWLLGVFVALSEGVVGSFSGKKLLLAAPILAALVAGWFGFHLGISIVFPPWALYLAGTIIAVAVFAAAYTLIPPAVSRITQALADKMTDGFDKWPSITSIIKGIIVAFLSLFAAIGASLFVFMAVSNVLPMALGLALAASFFVFIEISAFRGGRLYDELTFIFKLVQGKAIVPWKELTTFQKVRAVIGLVIISFVACGTASVAFVGVLSAPMTLAVLGITSLGFLFTGPVGLSVAIVIAIAAGICMAAIATRPLLHFMVGERALKATENLSFNEQLILPEAQTAGVGSASAPSKTLAPPAPEGGLDPTLQPVLAGGNQFGAIHAQYGDPGPTPSASVVHASEAGSTEAMTPAQTTEAGSAETMTPAQTTVVGSAASASDASEGTAPQTTSTPPALTPFTPSPFQPVPRGEEQPEAAATLTVEPAGIALEAIGVMPEIRVTSPPSEPAPAPM